MRADDHWPTLRLTDWTIDPEGIKRAPPGVAGRGPTVRRSIREALGSAVTASRSQGPLEEKPTVGRAILGLQAILLDELW